MEYSLIVRGGGGRTGRISIFKKEMPLASFFFFLREGNNKCSFPRIHLELLLFIQVFFLFDSH